MDQRWDGVFLDLGGVVLDLASVDRTRELFLERIEGRYDISVEDAEAVWRRTLGEYFEQRDGTEFRPAREGYERAMNQIIDEPLDRTDWWPLFVRSAGEGFEAIEGAGETIMALDDAGLYLGLISDIDAWEAEFILELFELIEAFDHVTTSEECGWTKPAPEIFEMAVEKAGIDPDRALYVGDRYEHDMKGGTWAGFRTVAFGGDAASVVAQPKDGLAVHDEYVDFVIEDVRDLLRIVGLDSD